MYSRTLVPLDESAASESVLLHVVAMPQAASLPVLLVEVAHPEWEHLGLLEDATPSPAIFNEANAQARKYLSKTAEALKDQGMADVKISVLHGDTAEAILRVTEEQPNTLIAMATRGRSGVGGGQRYGPRGESRNHPPARGARHWPKGGITEPGIGSRSA